MKVFSYTMNVCSFLVGVGFVRVRGWCLGAVGCCLFFVFCFCFVSRFFFFVCVFFCLFILSFFLLFSFFFYLLWDTGRYGMMPICENHCSERSGILYKAVWWCFSSTHVVGAWVEGSLPHILIFTLKATRGERLFEP